MNTDPKIFSNEHVLTRMLASICKGNLGAARVVTDALNVHRHNLEAAAVWFELLLRTKLTGSGIWEAFKDGCAEDLDAFMLAVARNDRALLRPKSNNVPQ